MLTELKVRNYLIIDELNIHFSEGLNVFTGETGSGKSIILEAIQGLISNRLNTDLIRVGAQKSYLEGSFEINAAAKAWLLEQEIDFDESESSIIISREISEKGSRARINGVLVPARQVQELGELLLEIHGQSTEHDIVQPKTQLAILDSYCGEAQQKSLNLYRYEYKGWKLEQNELNEQKQKLVDRDRELEFLRFQHKELSYLGLEDPEEENELKKQINRLSQADAVNNALIGLQNAFFEDENSVASVIIPAIKKLNDCAKYDEELQKGLTELQDVFEQMSDLVHDLGSKSSQIDEEVDIDALNERVSALQKMRRKYTVATLEELIAKQIEVEARIEFLENLSENLETLEKKVKKKEATLWEFANKLSEKRCELATELATKISESLASLGMHGAQFVINCSQSEVLTPDGANKVEFLFQANAGDVPRSLGKVASGGELSRIVLIFKTLLGADNFVLMFDEIDAGTSGKVSRLIGEKLSQISCRQQVICVTHQPLVAAFADKHFQVSKYQADGQTNLLLQNLTQEKEKIEALVDLMAGERDKILAHQYAQELIDQAKSKKHEFKEKQLQAIHH